MLLANFTLELRLGSVSSPERLFLEFSIYQVETYFHKLEEYILSPARWAIVLTGLVKTYSHQETCYTIRQSWLTEAELNKQIIFTCIPGLKVQQTDYFYMYFRSKRQTGRH